MARQNIIESVVERSAKEVKRYRLYMRFIPIGIAVLSLVLIIGYVISVLYMKFGAFTVMVNKFDNLDYALTLSPSAEFNTKTSRLNAEIDKEITNIDGATLPNYLDNIDGEHNGENYVAYTFYCRNEGKHTITYYYDLYIANMTYEIEKAVRVRLYVDGESVDYAYARTDGIKGPESGTTQFQTGNTIVKKEIQHFKPGDVTKYTVVIWLEGNDPDCVDKIIGGKFKVDMALSVVLDEDAESDGKIITDAKNEKNWSIVKVNSSL